MYRILCFLLIASAVLGCSRKSAGPPTAPRVISLDTAKARTYLALGDSYTIGQGVAASERFPYFLAEALRDSGFRVAAPYYIARTGWTTEDLEAAIAAEPSLGSFDLVTLLIGVNDQYRGRDTGSYAPRFTQLLQKAIALAGGRRDHVFVLSIPDYSATPFVPAPDKVRIRAAIDLYNSVNRRITLAYGISYSDITPPTRQAASDPSLLAPDGLHYSGTEHRQWVGLLAPEAAPVLR
jgi:lysophospholipase L1-like esterase